MRRREGNAIAAMQNVNTFLVENAAQIGDAINDQTKQMLADSLTQLFATATAQDSHTRSAAGALNRQRVKRLQLVRDHLRPIAGIAAFALPATPELVAFRIPRRRPTLQQLAALADGMAQAAAPYADVFIAAGRKREFIARLEACADDMRSASAERAMHRQRVKEATTDLYTQLSRSRKVVLMIDAFLQSALADRPGLLDAWNMAKRVPNTA